jgi:adenylyltransferase/sulfurtransferase
MSPAERATTSGDPSGGRPAEGAEDRPERRYRRQVLFAPLGEAGQARLAAARVLIVGAGALGSHAAEYLARAGVGRLRVVDRDLVEWSNLHRQIGYDEADASTGRPKAEALAARLARVNAAVEVEARVRDWNYTNALALAEGCDILLDGTDNLPARFLLNDVSYRTGTPWIYAGAVGASSHVQLFSGAAGPCLRCQLPELPPPGALATCDTAGVIGPAAGAAASWQAAWALRYLVERETSALAGRKAVFSLWEPEARIVSARADPSCPVCSGRRFEALEGRGSERAHVLCGRRAVQVLPAAGQGRLDLGAAAARLEALGPTEERGLLVRTRAADGVTLTLFDDGRAIFDGLTDPARARTLYARFVGQ